MYNFQLFGIQLAAFLILLSRLATSSTLSLRETGSITKYESSTNITHPIHNYSTPGNVIHVSCDGSHYGRDLNTASCRDIFGFLEPNDTQVVLAERHTGIYSDLPLPYRILSSALKLRPEQSFSVVTENVTGDARCFIQPMLAIGATSGHASTNNVGRAANTLFHHCVMGHGVGGVATEIGKTKSCILEPAIPKGADNFIKAMEAKTSSWR